MMGLMAKVVKPTQAQDYKTGIAAITIPRIARLAGVSIGSVDRALHDRPGINAQTKKKILEIARQHGYRPNRLGRILARRKTIELGVILLPTDNPFQDFLMRTIQQAVDELADFGLTAQLYALPQIDATMAARKVRQLVRAGVQGLALEGIEDSDLRQAVDEAAAGRPVITFNSDLPVSKRLCFVGQDLYRSGQVAADLLCRFLGGPGKVLILHGSQKVAAHQQRVEGFLEVCRRDFPRIHIVAVEESLDQNTLGYSHTAAVLQQHADLAGIYVVAGGVVGAAQALIDLQFAGKVRLVCNDIIPRTTELIQQGIIDATILQDPATQGQLPIKLLYQMIAEGIAPDKEFYHTKMDIVTKNML